MQCRNPRCQSTAVPGLKWCAPCGEVLARVREAMEAEQRGQRKGLSFSRRCRADGCPEPKALRSSFCPLHQHLEVE